MDRQIFNGIFHNFNEMQKKLVARIDAGVEEVSNWLN